MMTGYDIESAEKQNWYPDFTFICRNNSDIKFAVDLKTTYRDEEHPGFCNGFTLGSHGEYFADRTSTKNVQYPYGSYSGHFCLGIIYSRNMPASNDGKIFSADDIGNIPAVIRDFIFFAAEKWRIASDKSGSENFGRINVLGTDGKYKRLSSFSEYLRYRGLPESLNNPRKSKRKS